MHTFVELMRSEAARRWLEELASASDVVHAELFFEATESARLPSGAPARLERASGAALRRLGADGGARHEWSSEPASGRPPFAELGDLLTPGPDAVREPRFEALVAEAAACLVRLAALGAEGGLLLRRRELHVLTPLGHHERSEASWQLALESPARRVLSGLARAPDSEQLRSLLDALREVEAESSAAAPFVEPPPAGSAWLLMPQPAAILAHEVLGHTAELEVPGEISVRGELAGRRLTAAPLDFVDDPTAPGRAASYLVDDEGTRARPVAILERGRLGGPLADIAAARRAGTRPTGHARRSGFTDAPLARASNARLAGGEHDLAELLRRADGGVLVERVENGGMNPATGAVYLLADRLRRIEAGRPGRRLAPALLVGRALEVLAGILAASGSPELAEPISWCSRAGQTLAVSLEAPSLLLAPAALSAVAR